MSPVQPLPSLLAALLQPGLMAAALLAGLIAILAPAQAAVPLRIGIGLAKPPYFMPEDIELPGFEYEVAEKALAASGYTMLVESLPPARALALLRAGLLDGMLSVDEGIGGSHHFSQPYIHYQNVAVTLASRGIKLERVEDLLPYSVAAFQNARLILGDDFQRMAARHRDYREHPRQLTQNRLLFAGRADVVIGDKHIFRYLSRHMETPLPGEQSIDFHPLFPPHPRLAVFRDPKVRDAFDAGLRAIRRNGVYDDIARRYRYFVEP